jgi:hypothetical protein
MSHVRKSAVTLAPAKHCRLPSLQRGISISSSLRSVPFAHLKPLRYYSIAFEGAYSRQQPHRCVHRLLWHPYGAASWTITQLLAMTARRLRVSSHVSGVASILRTVPRFVCELCAHCSNLCAMMSQIARKRCGGLTSASCALSYTALGPSALASWRVGLWKRVLALQAETTLA